MTALRTRLSVLLPALLLVGCGPFGYLKKVAKDASKTVADAEAAGAEKWAPYEYWGAVSYLEQAKVLMAYSEYERSFDYGVRAKQLAEEAKAKADRRESQGDVVSDPNKPPAGDGPDKGDTKGDTKASGDAKASGSSGDGKAEGKASGGINIGGGGK